MASNRPSIRNSRFAYAKTVVGLNTLMDFKIDKCLYTGNDFRLKKTSITSISFFTKEDLLMNE